MKDRLKNMRWSGRSGGSGIDFKCKIMKKPAESFTFHKWTPSDQNMIDSNTYERHKKVFTCFKCLCLIIIILYNYIVIIVLQM